MRFLQHPVHAENYFVLNGVKDGAGGWVGGTITGMMRAVETSICAQHEFEATRIDNATLERGSIGSISHGQVRKLK